jgi:hypothetical protein
MGAVQINDNYRIDVDVNEFTIKQKRLYKNNKTGEMEDTWVDATHAHHNSWKSVMETMIKIFVDQKINVKCVVSMKELIQIYKETRAEVRELLKPLDGNK